MKSKILVGCPTSYHKAYCLKEYSKGLKGIDYENSDILIVDNSLDNVYFRKIKEQRLRVVKGPYFEGARRRIIESRNLIRKKVLDEDYDYLFSLEQDVVPPKEILKRFVGHKKKVVSGVYFNFQSIGGEIVPLPMLWSGFFDDGRMKYVDEKLIFENPSLIPVTACGLGCVLIHRDVLEKVKFRYVEEDPGFDDVWFSKDCRNNGFDIFADLSVRCLHITVPGGKWKGIKK